MLHNPTRHNNFEYVDTLPTKLKYVGPNRNLGTILLHQNTPHTTFCKIVIKQKNQQPKTWRIHGVNGWYIWLAIEHYSCYA